MRKAVGITSLVFGDNDQFRELYVVCDDGAIFKADADDFRCEWKEQTPVPGTERDADVEAGRVTL